MLSNLIRTILEGYVKRYLKSHNNIKLVVVTGSVGKTSTKTAIATLLNEHFNVRCQVGNHNSQMSVPVAILGLEYPTNIRNPFLWLSVFKQVRKKIHKADDVEIIVQELGSDKIGEIAHFGKYLKPDICVVSAVSSEHVEFFKTIDNIAQEELGVANYSKLAIINGDDIAPIYLKYINNKKVYKYGVSKDFDYRFNKQKFSIEKGYIGSVNMPDSKNISSVGVKVVGDHSLSSVMAALAVSDNLGLSKNEIMSGLLKIKPVSGRMNLLKGVKSSLIIDDTYNSSPLATACAIKTLYDIPKSLFSQRIVVLGDMNELGDTSDAEHKKIGNLCKSNQIDLVVTVGCQAQKFIAAAAKTNGCNVKSFFSSRLAGEFVKNNIKEKAVILMKGSQGGIFLEEAVKINLASKSDAKNLVRQSSSWMKRKEHFYSNLESK
jgi:UDP-N-acetylmuramoyl-tripeptide--D-alanyl-D-alanine ligase